MTQPESVLLDVLGRHLSAVSARSVLTMGLARAHVDMQRPQPGDGRRLLHQIERGVRLYLADREAQDRCLRNVAHLLESHVEGQVEQQSRVSLPVNTEWDIVTVRSAGRSLCQQIGFSASFQVKVATAISELARNIVQYAGTGVIELATLATNPPGIEIVARDRGPGIPHLATVLSGEYRSRTGMGMGLRGTRNLVDQFEIKTAAGQGTEVVVRAFLT
ncbi:MAG: anti-sigma regulatory factor [Deltaproteobacteria bacterium]|nr:anti-sigma regulatory factor [Deltaproteobacteria bacterium]